MLVLIFATVLDAISGRQLQALNLLFGIAQDLAGKPTTIPTNSTYWKNWPKQDNFYAAPYTWWSSFKKTIINVEATGKN